MEPSSDEDKTRRVGSAECEGRGLWEEPEDKSIGEFSDDEVKVEYYERFPRTVSVEQIYEEFRRRGDAPACLREFIYEHIGRILP